ncbi:hypothetical protein L7F22_058331 [Adiantum nelumboides]|nr:hypothetical protein [Adiantum nelumboides]
MVAFPVVLVCVVQCLGFTAQGIVAGSTAAFMMSLYGGQVAVGSIVAICQSIGALGAVTICACGPLFAIVATLSLLFIAILCLFRAHRDDFSHQWNDMMTQLGSSIFAYLSSL